MSDRYKLVPPGGGEHISFTVEAGSSVAEAYAIVGELLGRDLSSFSLLLRNPPGSALPFFHLRPADDVILRRSAPPGSVLVVEAEPTSAAADGNSSSSSSHDVINKHRNNDTERPGTCQQPSDFQATEDAITDAVLRSSAESHLAAGLATAVADSSCDAGMGTGLVGLSNLGNTCYLASAVQCLSHTPSLSSTLRETESAKGVSRACSDLLRALWSPSSSSSEGPSSKASPVAPRQLKAAVAEHARAFAGYEQQDAQELLQVLLECLHTELKRESPDKGNDDNDASAELPKEEAALADTLWSRSQRKDASVISDSLQGQVRSCTRCPKCEREEAIFEMFWSLPLPLPASSGGNQVWLDEALDNFCAEEPLDDCWTCEHCKEHTKGTKRTRLWRAPPVLQLQLKRFDWHTDLGTPATLSASSSSLSPPRVAAAEAAAAAGLRKQKLQRTDEDAAPSVDPPVSMAVDAPAASTSAPAEPAAPLLPPPTVPAEREEISGSSQPTNTLQGGDPPEEKEALPPIYPETALRDLASCSDFSVQVRMYELVGLFLLNIKKNPKEGKYRSVKKAGSRVRRDLLDLHGGEALLLWAGFRDEGERFEAPKEMTPELVETKYDELSRHTERERMQHLRRLDRLRVERNRQLALPHGDGGPPLRRWGGRLPSFGRGAAGFHGVRCVKVEASLVHRLDPSSPTGLAKLDLRNCFAQGSPEDVEAAKYRLVAVIHHLGGTPFSGHYIAYCWSDATGAWWKFNDGSVTQCKKDNICNEVLGSGAYVLFLEKE